MNGRASSFNPPNRFEEIRVEAPDEELAPYFEPPDPDRTIKTVYLRDSTKTVLSRNDSPDLGFAYSINPYRGCEHGCIYCYARPSHEYWGFSAGLDFETKIIVKPDAPELLSAEFQKRSWKPQTVMLSGNTDCYQPVERSLRITRGILEVFLRHRNPVSMITKNALVRRDVDLLKNLAALNLVHVTISVTSLRQELTRIMEPRTASPHKRLETVEVLAKAGIPVGVNVAPVIPGLNDEEIPAILRACADRGATRASYVMLRLPYAVKELFLDWLRRTHPERAGKVVRAIRETRNGKLSEPAFGNRMTGEGQTADAVRQLFKASCRRLGFHESRLTLSTQHFLRNPRPLQPGLF